MFEQQERELFGLQLEEQNKLNENMVKSLEKLEQRIEKLEEDINIRNIATDTSEFCIDKRISKLEETQKLLCVQIEFPDGTIIDTDKTTKEELMKLSPEKLVEIIIHLIKNKLG